MGGKRKKPAIPKVYRPTLQLVDETEGWVKKKPKRNDTPIEVEEQVKEATKTVRPDVRAFYLYIVIQKEHGKLILCLFLTPTVLKRLDCMHSCVW